MDIVAPDKVGFLAARTDRIGALMQRYVSEGQLAGMIALVARHAKIAYRQCFGMMDIEARKPMQLDTIFRLASMTKPITSVAAMMLYEEGHFQLNTPVSKFIPAFKHARVLKGRTENGLDLADLEREITIRHLFTHTAGLSYGFDENDPIDALYREASQELQKQNPEITLQDAMESLATLPLAFQPGTRWRYSLSIDVLGYLVQVISGLPLDTFVEERILQPLGMVDTAYYVPQSKVDRLAAAYGHTEGALGLQRLDVPMPSEPPTYVPGGSGLASTAHDYARFAQMLVHGGELEGVRLLSPTTVALFSMNHTPAEALPYGFRDDDLYHMGYGYGLGMRVLMDVSKTGMAGSVGEFGWDGAYSTYFWVDRTEDLFGLLMLQHRPNAYYPIAQQFKQLTYQALVG